MASVFNLSENSQTEMPEQLLHLDPWLKSGSEV